MEWTREAIKILSAKEIESLRVNSERCGRPDVAILCNEELKDRQSIKTRSGLYSSEENRAGQYVSQFHFVCPSELGLLHNSDGSVWTGTWVVAQKHAEAAENYQSIVALHNSKAEKSYLQGVIKAWRKSAREPKYSGPQATQILEGIDFMFFPTSTPLDWNGDGSGEKGYLWNKLPE